VRKIKIYKQMITALGLSCVLWTWGMAAPSVPKKAHTNSAYAHYPKVDYGTGPRAVIIKRGEYLTKAGDCIACHSDVQHGGKAFAGGLPIETPFGTFYSPNITSDKETGIGTWSAQDFYQAMHDGIRPDGAHYYPVFPYIYFNKMTKADILAVWAYFQAIPAVKQNNKGNDLLFPLNLRFGQYFWKALFYYPFDDPIQYIPHRGKAWNRGNYLVNGAGHCGMCHTPINFLGAPKRQYFLTGNFIEGYWAPNITHHGLSTASNMDLMKVFREDTLVNEAGRITGPMRQVNHDSLRHLSDSDIIAIATYLHTVKNLRPDHVHPAHELSLQRGKFIYQRACEACHQEGQMGAPIIGTQKSWFDRAREAGRITLYRHTINGYNQMPARGGCVECSDEDIESAVNYLLDVALSAEQKRDLKKPRTHKRATLVDGAAIYQTQCSACHDQGRLGAPILGDKKVWRRIINKNMDVLIRNKLKGSDRYPPKGGCKYCSTSEVIAAIKYMVNESKSKGDYSLW
jgi:cytochrome c5